MRRKEREITEKDQIEAILNEENICRIAINDDPVPYIVPLNYGYRNNALYIHCATSGRKIDLIKKNNKVAFEIESKSEIISDEVSCKWTTEYKCLMGVGSIEIISDFEAKKEGLNILMEHHGKMDNHYNDKAVEKVLILKLQIEEISGKQSV
jgi:nitroimidazol reductase NimA-like FMN-containing flavoprotein (pyridoxamine 5'-phosphate oxidase superfamily)